MTNRVLNLKQLIRASNLGEIDVSKIPMFNPGVFTRRWDWLSWLIKAVGAKTFVELGVKEAQNISILARRNPQCNFIGIDAWTKLPGLIDYDHETNQARAFDLARGFRNLMLIEGFTNEKHDIAKTDIVFIDGDHSFEGVKADLKTWAMTPASTMGQAIICGHDIRHLGVIEAHKWFIKEYGGRIIDVGVDGCWYWAPGE